MLIKIVDQNSTKMSNGLNPMQNDSNREYNKEKVNAGIELLKKEKLLNIFQDINPNFKYINPDADESIRKTFLEDSSPRYVELKNELKRTIQVIQNSLVSTTSKAEFLAYGKKLVDEKKALLNNNQEKIKKETKSLYRSLRQLDLFYKNTGKQKLKDLSILTFNQNLIKKDPNNAVLGTLSEHVSQRFLEFDKRNCVGYIVCPYFPGGEALSQFATMASQNRVQFFCSYHDFPDVETVLERIPNDQIGGPEPMWSNVVVFANTFLSEDGTELSPASAIGGRLYETKISQPVAGYMNGNVRGISGVKFKVNEEDLKSFKKAGVIPIIRSWDKPIALGMWTAYKGEDIDYEQYSIVRVRDWISRCLANHLRKFIGTNASKEVLSKINIQISDFLVQLKNNGIIEDGLVSSFDRNNIRPDQIDIAIELTYLYALRLFTYKFLSTKDKVSSATTVDIKDKSKER